MKNQASRPHNPQSGSIFIWIFVMIALFGALSYALLQGSRGGTSTLDSDKAKLLVTEILTSAQKMQTTVQQLRINGCKDEEISFEGGAGINGNYTNPLSTTPCKVFDVSGGALNLQKPAAELGDTLWVFVGNHCYEGIGSTGACSPETTELELNLVGIPDTVCIEINKISGIADPSSPLPHENYSASPPTSGIFKGTYTGSSSVANRIEGIGLSGKRYGCYQDDTGSLLGKNVFYYILIAR